MVNDYLKSAVKRYKESITGKFLVNPISEMDVRILLEFRKLFSKTHISKDIIPIIDEYKLESDSSTLSSLKELNKKISPSSQTIVGKLIDAVVKGDTKDDKELKNFLKIENSFIRHNCIFGVDSVDCVEHDEGEDDEDFGGIPVYKIIINPLHGQDLKNVPAYADFEIKYYNEEDRNKDLEMVHQFLESSSQTRE